MATISDEHAIPTTPSFFTSSEYRKHIIGLEIQRRALEREQGILRKQSIECDRSLSIVNLAILTAANKYLAQQNSAAHIHKLPSPKKHLFSSFKAKLLACFRKE